MSIQEILKKLNIEQLNAMQMAAGKALADDRQDLVLLSPTGSGKTLAYLLPLALSLNPESDHLQAVVIVPGRELAAQSAEVLDKMGMGIRGLGVYGGRPAMDEHRIINKVKPQVLFATPGRLNDHIDKGNINPATVRFLVIDEFDKCLQMGFLTEMRKAMGKLKGVRRKCLLSATQAEEIPEFVDLKQALLLDFSVSSQTSERLLVHQVASPEKDKLPTLCRLLSQLGNGGAIVFLNYRDAVERTWNKLREKGFAAVRMHGGLEQKEREEALYMFANGSATVLVATDLASRGLDVPDVKAIIHYHLPLGEQEYVHRVGRTARWQNTGEAFFLLSPGETIPEFIQADVETFLLTDIPSEPPIPRMATLYIGKGKLNKISKGDVVGFLCKKGGLQATDIGRIDVYERYAYAAVCFEKADSVLKTLKGEKIKGLNTLVERVR